MSRDCAAGGLRKSKGDKNDGREPAAKLVKTEAVRQEKLPPTVEVVGTLAAEDEVTISSQAEGIVRRVLADLATPSNPARRWSRSIRRSCNTPSTSRGPPTTCAHEIRRVGVGSAAAGRGDGGGPQGGRRAGAGKQAHERATELHRRTLILNRRSTTWRRRCD